jgi:hydroxyacylglutathione hydrolase
MLIYEGDDIKVHSLTLGTLRTNCFIIQNSYNTFLVDPVNEAEVIADYLKDNDLSIDFCMATHGHFDHIGAAAYLIENKFCDTLYIHHDDAVELKRCNTYSLLLDKKRTKLPFADNIVWFNKAFEEQLNKSGFEIEHMPGHTAGSAILFSNDRRLLFSGDIILKHGRSSSNRCKIGESKEGVQKALHQIARTFPAECLVFPGHGKMMPINSKDALQSEFQRLRHDKPNN